uniref:RxLR effector protein n=1 Tax=Phytophthora agathidicida TaxID=1642459 RepID=A0A7G4WI02_9STRA|nr:PaRXLR13 [Phytophthora agathidicida]
MRHYFVVLLFAAYLALSAATEYEDKLQPITKADVSFVARALTDDQSTFPTKRALRTHDTAIFDNEERAIPGFTQLKNLLKTKDVEKLKKLANKEQYRQWLKDGEDPNTIYKKLGLTGMGPAANLKNDPRFHQYLEFSALWRRKKGMLAKEWWQFWRKNAW